MRKNCPTRRGVTGECREMDINSKLKDRERGEEIVDTGYKKICG